MTSKFRGVGGRVIPATNFSGPPFVKEECAISYRK